MNSNSKLNKPKLIVFKIPNLTQSEIEICQKYREIASRHKELKLSHEQRLYLSKLIVDSMWQDFINEESK